MSKFSIVWYTVDYMITFVRVDSLVRCMFQLMVGKVLCWPDYLLLSGHRYLYTTYIYYITNYINRHMF